MGAWLPRVMPCYAMLCHARFRSMRGCRVCSRNTKHRQGLGLGRAGEVRIELVVLLLPLHELAASLLLWALALMVGLLVGRMPTSWAFWRTLAQVKTRPLTKPRKMAVTLPKVTGASKKIRPLMAMGSLFSEPTIEYVVDEVTRMHHAEQYEMEMAARPE